MILDGIFRPAQISMANILKQMVGQMIIVQVVIPQHLPVEQAEYLALSAILNIHIRQGMQTLMDIRHRFTLQVILL
jgi:hypothetical protein